MRSDETKVTEQRRALTEVARRIAESGLSRGTSGNVSARIGASFLVSPTGATLGALEPADFVLVDLDGAVSPGQRAPSSEWGMHRDLYQARPEAAAIVHAHPPFATTLACHRRDLPAVHYEIAIAGGHDVRCATYATFGTDELSRAAQIALEGRKACLLANHGLLAFGDSPAAALKIAETVETVAELYVRACALGEPMILDREEMDRVVAKFATYGQPR